MKISSILVAVAVCAACSITVACSGGGTGSNTGTPYSYNTGYATPGTSTGRIPVIVLANVPSGAVPSSCSDFAALDGGSPASLDRALLIQFPVVTPPLATGSYATCNTANCPGQSVVNLALPHGGVDGGALVASTIGNDSGTVIVTSVSSSNVVGSYDATPDYYSNAPAGTSLHLTGTFNVVNCPNL